jgi:RNA ligase (TIGR02306 family)
MTRKLVTIRKVLDLQPIPKADNIELAVIGGWQCVVKKGEFNVGDLGLFFEIDSLVPENDMFEFLRKGNKPKSMITENGDTVNGFKLKTIRLKGQLSQGLLLPLSMFPNIDFNDTKKDYSTEVGVIKYEPPIPTELQGKIKGVFPTEWFPKTNQERVQNIDFESVKEETLIVTEKLHGTSMTVYKYNGVVGVCSRNWELRESEDNTMWKVVNQLKLKEKIKDNIAIQGELIGEGINKNMYNVKGHKWLIFDVYDIDNKNYYTTEQMISFCEELGLDSVPILTRRNFKDFNIQQVIKYAEGQSVIGNCIREGVVCKNLDRTISFKIINNEFLIKKGE